MPTEISPIPCRNGCPTQVILHPQAPRISASGLAPSPSQLRWWIAPSQVLSVSADIFLAAVFYASYGLSSLNLFFVLSCLYYAVLQRPAYEDIFIGPHANPQSVVA